MARLALFLKILAKIVAKFLGFCENGTYEEKLMWIGTFWAIVKMTLYEGNFSKKVGLLFIPTSDHSDRNER